MTTTEKKVRKMRTKKFSSCEKRAIFKGGITLFLEIIDDELKYPFHKEKTRFGKIIPAWEYEFFRHGITEGEKFLCYAKASCERKDAEETGLRSDHTISVSRFRKDEILKISTKDMYMYPREKEVDTGFFYIKIIDAKVIIRENSFWWEYKFERIEYSDE